MHSARRITGCTHLSPSRCFILSGRLRCYHVHTQPYDSAEYRAPQRAALHDVHLWWMNADQVTGQQLLQLQQLLTPEELQYVSHAQAADVQRERLLARAFVRCILSKYLPNTAPQQLQFLRSTHGKPYLHLSSAAAADQGIAARLQFNLAHTQSVLGCAVSLSGLHLGLDVEHLTRGSSGSNSNSSGSSNSDSSSDNGSSGGGSSSRRDVLKLARRRFTQQEVALLEGVPDVSVRRQLFMVLWTLKEAVVKAKGSGINAPPGLRGFSVGLVPTGAPAATMTSQSDESVLFNNAPGQEVRGTSSTAALQQGLNPQQQQHQQHQHQQQQQPLRLLLQHHDPQPYDDLLLLLKPHQQVLAALCVRLPQSSTHPCPPPTTAPPLPPPPPPAQAAAGHSDCQQVQHTHTAPGGSSSSSSSSVPAASAVGAAVCGSGGQAAAAQGLMLLKAVQQQQQQQQQQQEWCGVDHVIAVSEPPAGCVVQYTAAPAAAGSDDGCVRCDPPGALDAVVQAAVSGWGPGEDAGCVRVTSFSVTAADLMHGFG